MDRTTTKECSLAELRPELIEVVKEHLSSDDKPLICCETEKRWGGDYGGTSFNAYVITQHRIVEATSRLRGFLDQLFGSQKYETSVSSMFLADIAGISEEDVGHGIGFYVRAHGQGDFQNIYVFESRQASLKFTSILRQAVEQARATTTSQIQRNSAERLRELAQLHKDGLISDTEFQQKRKEILGQL